MSVQHYVPIPDDVAEHLLRAETRRMIVTFNGHTERRALHNMRGMGPAVMLSQRLMRQLRLDYGDIVEAAICVDPDPDYVEMCEEFVIALEQDQEAAERFYAMTPGKRRSLAQYPNSAKRVETRIKRSLELAFRLRTFTLHSDK